MVLAFLLSAAALQGMPADPAAFDMRCMIVTERLRESSDQNLRNMALAAMTFYFGRVDARLDAAQIEAALRSEEQAERTMNEADLRTALQACGSFMTARGNAIQVIASHVEGPPTTPPHP